MSTYSSNPKSRPWGETVPVHLYSQGVKTSAGGIFAGSLTTASGVASSVSSAIKMIASGFLGLGLTDKDTDKVNDDADWGDLGPPDAILYVSSAQRINQQANGTDAADEESWTHETDRADMSKADFVEFLEKISSIDSNRSVSGGAYSQWRIVDHSAEFLYIAPGEHAEQVVAELWPPATSIEGYQLDVWNAMMKGRKDASAETEE